MSTPRLLGFLRPTAPKYSVVICSIDNAKFAAVEANYKRLFAKTPIEIIRINDARSLSEGYNRGLRTAKGEFVIFSHDDIRILSPDFEQRIARHLSEFDLVGVAGTRHVVGGAWFLAGHPFDFQFVTSPDPESANFVMVVRGGGAIIVTEIQALDGLFFACRRKMAVSTGFDQVTFDGFHGYDMDFSYRAFLAGNKLAVCRDLFIIHYSHGRFDQVWDRYRRRFEAKYSIMSPPNSPRPANVVPMLLDRRFVEDASHHPELCALSTVEGLIAKANRQYPL